MFYRICLLLILTAAPAAAQVAIPDTPAGHTFQAWLEASIAVPSQLHGNSMGKTGVEIRGEF